MSESYGTEFEIRQEIAKRTTKEILQKLKLWLHRPTEDIRIINTEMLMLEKIEKDLEVLEIIKHIVKIADYSDKTIQGGNLVILVGGEIKTFEEYQKIKGWLNDK